MSPPLIEYRVMANCKGEEKIDELCVTNYVILCSNMCRGVCLCVCDHRPSSQPGQRWPDRKSHRCPNSERPHCDRPQGAGVWTHRRMLSGRQLQRWLNRFKCTVMVVCVCVCVFVCVCVCVRICMC